MDINPYDSRETKTAPARTTVWGSAALGGGWGAAVGAVGGLAMGGSVVLPLLLFQDAGVRPHGSASWPLELPCVFAVGLAMLGAVGGILWGSYFGWAASSRSVQQVHLASTVISVAQSLWYFFLANIFASAAVIQTSMGALNDSQAAIVHGAASITGSICGALGGSWWAAKILAPSAEPTPSEPKFPPEP